MKRTYLVSGKNANWRGVMHLMANDVCEAIGKGEEVQVQVGPVKRTKAENALLHALISELSRKLEWAGQRRDPETWKRLLVAAWCRADGAEVETVPALDGQGLDVVPVRTSGLTKRACADLIEWIQWWGTEQGVLWEERR